MSWLKAKDWPSGMEYSSLFHSGLRAISLRPCPFRARANSVAVSSSEKRSNGRGSRLLRLSTTRKGSRNLATSTTESTSTTEPSSPPSRTERVARPRPSSMIVRSTKELSEPWSSGGTFEFGKHHKFSERDQDVGCVTPPVETYSFWSHPGSGSFFVNLGDIDANANPPKEESLLSLSSSPDVHPLPQRERTVSIQTTPLPTHRPSLYNHTRDTKREKLDHAWMLEESSPELKAQESRDDEDVLDLSLERDAADWRQFHVDWLQNEPTIQLTPVPTN
ncbi:hypothetical protein BS17DRAFT_767161 [Gyrodon lividus]|nr:hypothetical protein BS17DRAFT_767161 [Gyrodon lividus]